MKRIVAIGLLCLALLLTVLVVGGIIFLKSDAALGYALARLNAAIPGRVALSKHDFSLLHGHLDLTGLVVAGPDGEELCGFERLRLDWSWGPLLKRELHLDRLILAGPWADLEMDAKGEVNLLQAFGQPAEREDEPPVGDDAQWPGFNLVVDHLSVEAGRATVALTQQGLRLGATRFDLHARGDLARRVGELSLETSSIHIFHPQIETSLDGLRLQAGIQDDRLLLTSLEMDTAPMALHMAGKVADLFTRPLLDVTLQMTADLAALQKLLDLPEGFSGKIAGKVTIEGDPFNPDATFSLDYGGGDLAGFPVEKLEMAVTLGDRQLQLKAIEAHLAQGRVESSGQLDLRPVFPQDLRTPSPDLNAATFALQTRLVEIALAPFIPELMGHINGQISLQGSGLQPGTLTAAARLDASVEGLRGPPMGDSVSLDLTAGVKMDRQTLTLEDLKIQMGGLQLTTKGSFDMATQAVAAALSLHSPDLQEIAQSLAPVGMAGLCGSLDINGRIQGTLRQPEMRVELAGAELGFGEFAIGTLQMTAELDGEGQLHIPRLSLANRGAAVTGSAHAALLKEDLRLNRQASLEADITFQGIEPRHFMLREPIQGGFNGRLRLGGNLTNPTVRLDLVGEKLAYREFRLGDLETQVRFADKKIVIAPLKVTNGDSNLSLEGSAQLFAQEGYALRSDPAFQLTFKGTKFSLQDFSDTLAGKIQLSGQAGGTLKKPVGQFNLTAGRLDLGVQTLAGIDLHAKLSGNRIQVDPLEVRISDDEFIRGQGWLDADRSYDFCLVSDGMAINTIDHLRQIGFLEGVLTMDICGRGTLAQPSLAGDIAVKGIRINEQPLDDYRLHVNLAKDIVQVEAELDFMLSASYHLKEKRFAIDGQFKDTQLAPYFAMLGREKFGGGLAGSLHAKGRSDDLGHVQATLDLSRLELRFEDRPVITSDKVQAHFKERYFSIPNLELSFLEQGRFQLAASGSLTGDIRADLSGEIPLKVAQLFVPELQEPEGRFEVYADIKGSVQNPVVHAEVEFKQIGLVVPVLLQELQHLNGTMILDNRRLALDAITGRLDNGRFDLGGKIDLENFQPRGGEVSFSAFNLPIEIPDTLNLLVNTQLELKAGQDQSLVQGEIIIVEGVYYRDVKINLIREITRRRRAQAPVPKPIKNPLLQRTQVDLIIRSRNPFEVDNNLAALSINPDLKVHGTLAQPTMSGRASVTEGQVTYLGKTFVVQKGDIDFLNPYKMEPTLDIISETPVRDGRWIITLSITGTPDELVFTMSSVPEESNNDIVSLLLFGKTSQEFAEGKSGTVMSTQQLMAELIASTFGGDLKKATGIDILELETTQEGQESSDRIKVTMGKNLSRRLTVKYAVESKDGELTQRAISEYKLLENFLVNGFQDNKGVYGGELIFRLEFR